MEVPFPWSKALIYIKNMAPVVDITLFRKDNRQLKWALKIKESHLSRKSALNR